MYVCMYAYIHKHIFQIEVRNGFSSSFHAASKAVVKQQKSSSKAQRLLQQRPYVSIRQHTPAYVGAAYGAASHLPVSSSSHAVFCAYIYIIYMHACIYIFATVSLFY